MYYRDRSEAGRVLAGQLRAYADQPDVIVLALPRGGVPVAFEVAQALHAPLDIFLVRKLGLPGHEELAMGAIASGGVRVLNEDVVRTLRVPEEVVDEVAAEEQQELERRERGPGRHLVCGASLRQRAWEDSVMATSSVGSQRVLGTLSVVFGGLGLLLFWFEPFGQLLGATGIALGLAGVLLAVSHGGTR